MFSRHRIIQTSAIGVPVAAAIAAAVFVGTPPAAHGTEVARETVSTVAVGPQYDAAHVYVQPGTEVTFVKSWEATFGGTNTTPTLTDLTPTSSETVSELVFSPVGFLSLFDYKTAIPYPFGQERDGDLVASFSQGVADAARSGALLVVSPWNDPIGKDAIVQFPGGVDEEIYGLTKPLSLPPLATIPQSRVYLEPQAAEQFIRDYLAFSDGRIVLDDPHADGSQIGLPGTTFREVLIDSAFGQTLVIITDGHLPYPFGRETTGYTVTNLTATLAKAKAAGAEILWGPYRDATDATAIVQFPGGYIAEVHQDRS
jgi:hypothetical protein